MMRRLYYKILLHWIVALAVTEILIFGLFVLVTKDAHRSYVVETVGRTALIARDYIEAATDESPARGERSAAGKALQGVVERLGKSAHAKVWIVRVDGTTLSTSFAGTIKPPVVSAGKSTRYGDASVNIDIGQKRLSYSTVPITLGNPKWGKATLHILTEREPGRFPHGAFGAGLALIGAVFAVLAIPLSFHITKPLKRLQESALRIAGGDLTARTDVRGNDEIGMLGTAFNSMADTVERMVRAGRELTANVSHEMRSPLTRIRVAGECLREAVDRGDSADSKEMLKGMWEDIDEADRMIGSILEYSKLDLHEPVPAASEVFPAAILDGLLKSMRPLFRTKRIAIEAKLEPEMAVTGDEQLLRVACKNVIENAARYTPEGGEVRIAMHHDGSAVSIDVTNSAAPLAAEDLEHIFEPFFRCREAGSNGTGLGLAITKKIIGYHGGDIGAENTSRGFRLWLRLVRAAPPREK